MTTSHAVFAPSSAHRWIACPASALLPADSGPKPAADRGRQLHEAAEILLLLGAPPTAEALQIALENAGLPDATDDERDAVSGYVEFVRSRRLPDSKLNIEHRIYLTPLTGEANAYGTADAVIITSRGTAPGAGWDLEVIDFKTGRVPVSAANNEQLMLYAAGLVTELQCTPEFRGPVSVTGWIYQPFVRAEPDSCRWSGEELLAWVASTVKPAVEAALGSQPPYKPGPKQCRWCPAAATCRALQEQVQASVSSAFPAFEQDGTALAQLLDLAELAELWVTRIRAHVTEQVRQGLEVPGWGLKDGRRLRSWGDADEAAEVLTRLFGEAAYVRELISPAQAEKLAKRKKLDGTVLQSLIAEKRGEPRLCRTGAPADPAFEPVGE